MKKTSRVIVLSLIAILVSVYPVLAGNNRRADPGDTPVHASEAKQRPLADFINAQGTTTCFTPPAPAQLGASSDFDNPPIRFALVDYTGLTGKFLFDTYGISLGTTVSGSVSERPLDDGRAEVTVNLHTSNALAWAMNFDPTGPVSQFNNNPLLFGARAQDVAPPNSMVPALADIEFRLVFKNTAPGAPLPDLVCINQGPDCPNVASCPAGFEIDFLSVYANATGPLHALAGLGPEGTPGRLVVTQTGLIKPGIHNGFRGALSDAFPAESIELHRIGEGSTLQGGVAPEAPAPARKTTWGRVKVLYR
jgi:hypothetical protein